MRPDKPFFSPGTYAAYLVDWLNANLHPWFDFLTKSVESVLGGFTSILLFSPSYLLIMIVGIVVWFSIGLRTAILAVACLTFCWFAGLWSESMQTISLVTVAVVLSTLIGFPLGILASRYPGFGSGIRPVLDIMQTVPPWVYLLPAVMILGLGEVPALVATVIYGIPPMLRVTKLAFDQTPHELLELGKAIGAFPRTILLKIEIPTAMPTLLVGLNQCILLSLSMVVLAGLVGAGGLGGEVTRGLSRMDMGLGLRAGLSIVAIALMLDGLTRGVFQHFGQNSNNS